ncbi:Oidioi.mRNA.OKI2018_I69.PAR.g8629.t1.cds [Oikopleura dioica]|uniref:Oidioi.mRNA.OKI2018_I69.PAR.g8629.t1.cds n=1 Tax=Oikopleura dioica TaxID=34765 RepID=A0ABN7RGV2_OIKDI|nr:Oidioi.mRNA.OKI2018_I69.PAR.g8629.t1.cds [Oikopleura dioica]
MRKILWLFVLTLLENCQAGRSKTYGHAKKNEVHLRPIDDRRIIVEKDVFCTSRGATQSRFFSWAFVDGKDKEFLISGHEEYFTIAEIPFRPHVKAYFPDGTTSGLENQSHVSAKISCERAFGETEHCSNYITSISQKKNSENEGLNFQICNSNFAQPKLETWNIDLENFDEDLSKAVSKETEFATANSCPSSFKSSTLMKWIDSTMRVAAIGLQKEVSSANPAISVFAFGKEAFSTKGARGDIFIDARFRLITADSEQIHFLYSDVPRLQDIESRETFFRANSHPKIASICRHSGFEILNQFHFGELNCKEEDFDFPIFVDAVETERHVFGIFQSRAKKYQKNAICRFEKKDLAIQCSQNDPTDDLQILSRQPVEGELVMSPRDSSEYGGFTSITVDSEKTGDFPLIFIGTDSGVLLKTAKFEKYPSSEKVEYPWQLVEAYNIEKMAKNAVEKWASDDWTIKKIHFRYDKHGTLRMPYVYVATDQCILAVKVQNCDLSECCQNDPYCEFRNVPKTCQDIDFTLRNPLNQVTYHRSCQEKNEEELEEKLVSNTATFLPVNLNDDSCSDAQNGIQQASRKEYKRVKNLLDRVTRNLTHPEILKQAMLSAAEIVLHRVYNENLDTSIPVPIQSSQISVFPELAFHLQVLREQLAQMITPSRANATDCYISPSQSRHGYCGIIEHRTKWSRQIWNWMRQLLSAYSADCTTKENPILTGQSKLLCKESICRFGFLIDVQTAFRETGLRATGVPLDINPKELELKSDFSIVGLVVENKTSPFEITYNPDIQEAIIKLHFNVDLCLLSQHREKFENFKNFRSLPENVKKAYSTLATEIHEKMKETISSRKKRETSRTERCPEISKRPIIFESSATENLTEKEFEIFLVLFERYGSCEASKLSIGQRTSLRRIFGGRKSAASLLTYTLESPKCRYTVDINKSIKTRSSRDFSLEFIGSTKKLSISFFAKHKSR